MAVKSTLEQLEEVQAAITRALIAQSSGMGDKTVMRARLDLLTQRETLLLQRYNAETGSGGVPAFNTAIPKRLY